MSEEKIVSLFNPTKTDFTVNYDSKPLKMALSMQFTQYPYSQAKHVYKHLIDHVMNVRSIKHTDKKEHGSFIREQKDIKKKNKTR